MAGQNPTSPGSPKVSIGPRVSLFAQQTDVLLFAVGQLAAQGAIEELALLCRLELDPQSNKPGPLGCWDRSDLGPYLSCLLLPALKERGVDLDGFVNCKSEPLASSRRGTKGRAGRLEHGGKNGFGFSFEPEVLAVLEHVQESLGEGSERTALITGQAGDLFPKEPISQDPRGHAWGLPPERLELLNVRDRPVFD